MPKTETILFCPLNWGLGHATRLVPLIKQALNSNNKVIIAANGAPLKFLKQEFPNVQFVIYKGFGIKYWPKPFFNLGLFLQLPLFYSSIFKEHHQVKELVKQYNVSKIISDNRYGAFSLQTENILITHQLFIKVPKLFKVFEPAIHLITRGLISKFDECWVPDFKDHERSLSGELSHGKAIPENVKYIGPLSRFKDFEPPIETTPNNIPEVLAIISGPEPARTQFEKQIEHRFKEDDRSVLMVCGKPMEQKTETDGFITKVPHLSTTELFWYIKLCDLIIARSGYSTIMDLHVMNRKAELSPTPGQPEQEYLYQYNRTT